MTIDKLLIPILNNIHFSARFKNLSDTYGDFENKLDYDDIEKIKFIITSLGYKIRFNKTENFFKLIEKLDSFKFQFNIVIQRGVVEFIWSVEKNQNRLKMGGSICGAIEILTAQKYTKKPIFTNYQDLEEILKEAFSIYEDFKREVLNIFGKEK